MAESDYILNPAVTGPASSTEFTENMEDLEDANNELGVGIISGGIMSAGGGLSVNIGASEYLIGVPLTKGITNVALTPSALNRIWAVTDPDNVDRVVYVVRTNNNAVARACYVGAVQTDGAAPVTYYQDGWYIRPAGAPINPNRDVVAGPDQQTVHQHEQAIIAEKLTVRGILTVQGKVRVIG